MRKLIALSLILTSFTACNQNGTISEEKINAAGDKLQKTVEKTADTVANKVGRWADSVKSKRDTTY